MTRRLLLGAVAVGLLAFVVLPLAVLVPGAGAFERLPEHADALLNTVWLAAGVTLGALSLGAPLGYAFARYRLPGWLTGASLLPYAVPPYVTTIAWIALANPSTGWLRALAPVDAYSLGGMVWVLSLHLAPVVALGVRDAVGRLDPALEEAARLCGASPARVLRDVTLPMLAPALVASAGFVASAAIASFGVPYLLSAAAAEPVPVLTTRIYQALDLGFTAGRPIATTLALLLLLVGAALPLLSRALLAGRSYSTARPVSVPPAPAPGWARAAVGAWVAVAVALPAGTIVWTSLMRSTGGGFGVDNLTLATWEKLAADPRVLDALGRSAWLAGAAATVAVAVGGLLAYVAEREHTRTGRFLAALGRAGYAVPGTVLALGLLVAWSQEVRLVVLDRVTFALALADTAWILGIAYVVKFLALPIDGARAAIRQVHPSLEEAARLSGASWARAIRDVTLPLLLPALGTAWFLVFVPSFCEVTLSVLLRGPETQVLGTLLFYLQSYADAQSAAALAVLVTVVLLVGMGLGRLVRRAA